MKWEERSCENCGFWKRQKGQTKDGKDKRNGYCNGGNPPSAVILTGPDKQNKDFHYPEVRFPLTAEFNCCRGHLTLEEITKKYGG